MFPRNVGTTSRLHGATAQETTISNDRVLAALCVRRSTIILRNIVTVMVSLQ